MNLIHMHYPHTFFFDSLIKDERGKNIAIQRLAEEIGGLLLATRDQDQLEMRQIGDFFTLFQPAGKQHLPYQFTFDLVPLLQHEHREMRSMEVIRTMILIIIIKLIIIFILIYNLMYGMCWLHLAETKEDWDNCAWAIVDYLKNPPSRTATDGIPNSIELAPLKLSDADSFTLMKALSANLSEQMQEVSVNELQIQTDIRDNFRKRLPPLL